MPKFIIQPHGRLQEWIAHEQGYFRDEGLDYEFVHGAAFRSAKQTDAAGQVVDVVAGAFESYKHGGGNKGVKSDISCACHWTVNQAAAERHGTMWGKSYVVTPGGVMVPPESPIMRPEDLAGQEVAVGYRSGSHYATLQALEAFLPREQIKLRFVGSQWARVDIGIDRDVPATSVWGLTGIADGAQQRRDRDRRRQGAQVEGAAPGRQSSPVAQAARGLARLHLRQGGRPEEPVPLRRGPSAGSPDGAERHPGSLGLLCATFRPCPCPIPSLPAERRRTRYLGSVAI
jgi:hypothetical protein